MQSRGEHLLFSKNQQNQFKQKQPRIHARETCRNGRPETCRKRDQENGKAKGNVSTYNDALMR